MNKLRRELKNPNLIDMEEVVNDISEYISDDDLRRYFGQSFDKKILKYSELDNYSSIDKLLPKSRDFCIILVENEYNSGHWCGLLKYGKTTEFFNPYGTRPGGELDFNDKAKNDSLEQFEPYLNQLLDKELMKGRNVIYNKKR